MKTAIAAILIICCLMAAGLYMFPAWATDRLLEREARAVLRSLYSNEPHAPGVDYWGNAIANRTEVRKELIAVQVISAGRDGKIGTKDDQHFEKLDLNKSYLLSRWAGSKIKEAGKGVMDGLKSKSPFKR